MTCLAYVYHYIESVAIAHAHAAGSVVTAGTHEHGYVVG